MDRVVHENLSCVQQSAFHLKNSSPSFPKNGKLMLEIGTNARVRYTMNAHLHTLIAVMCSSDVSKWSIPLHQIRFYVVNIPRTSTQLNSFCCLLYQKRTSTEKSSHRNYLNRKSAETFRFHSLYSLETNNKPRNTSKR